MSCAREAFVVGSSAHSGWLQRGSLNETLGRFSIKGRYRRRKLGSWFRTMLETLLRFSVGRDMRGSPRYDMPAIVLYRSHSVKVSGRRRSAVRTAEMRLT